jgi:tRNA-specific 2-thiouridylase
LVRKLRPDAGVPGDIVDLEGRVLGTHRGIIGFTIGQRRGLEIGGLADPLYVVRLDAARNQVIVGPRAALAVQAARLSEFNKIGPVPDDALTTKVRSTARPAPARIEGDRLVFDVPEYGVSPGQAAVLYAGDRVIGGGWIEETEPAERATA